MTHKSNVSAIIISKNESDRIVECIKNLYWTGEIIVIDNNSIDDTIALAKEHNARVYESDEKSFAKLRDIGAKHAVYEWLLYVDADELVGEDLRKEIIEIIGQSTNDVNAYFISRKNYYLGSVWPTQDGMVRLMRKNSLLRWEGILHEHAITSGNVGSLKNYFIHDTHRTLAEMVAKTNQWSHYEAKLRFDNHHPKISWWRFIRVMITAFTHTYVSDGGWRAGTVGWIESIYQAFSMFITYAKLWEMQVKK